MKQLNEICGITILMGFKRFIPTRYAKQIFIAWSFYMQNLSAMEKLIQPKTHFYLN